jgi:hypothetical protein
VYVFGYAQSNGQSRAGCSRTIFRAQQRALEWGDTMSPCSEGHRLQSYHSRATSGFVCMRTSPARVRIGIGSDGPRSQRWALRVTVPTGGLSLIRRTGLTLGHAFQAAASAVDAVSRPSAGEAAFRLHRRRRARREISGLRAQGRAALRKPSSLISVCHCGPVGAFSTSCES